jgi:hypothetical protein
MMNPCTRFTEHGISSILHPDNILLNLKKVEGGEKGLFSIEGDLRIIVKRVSEAHIIIRVETLDKDGMVLTEMVTEEMLMWVKDSVTLTNIGRNIVQFHLDPA